MMNEDKKRKELRATWGTLAFLVGGVLAALGLGIQKGVGAGVMLAGAFLVLLGLFHALDGA